MTPTAGAYPLLGVGKLPNADVASPGEVWSNARANGVIIPGAAVVTAPVGGKLAYKQIVAGDNAGITDKARVAVALRQIAVPDVNPGSLYSTALGPNEIVNLAIADTDWVRTYHTGVMHLSLVVPDAAEYAPGDLVGWDDGGARPSGKAAGTGAWNKSGRGGTLSNTVIFEVREWRPFGTAHEGVLTVRFLRSNQ